MSTPADLIKPFLLAANTERPDLAQTNTLVSCAALLKLTLQKAGKDWAFVGKSTGNGMDGSGYPLSPAQDISCVRPDGQAQMVHIDAVSQDACWWLPGGRQVKVIANSSANDDPNPAIHGPAQLTPYDIDPVNYRWHNPAIAQSGSAPPPQPPQSLPSYEALGGDAYFRSAVGVPLQADMALVGQMLNDGSSVWFSRTIYDILAAGGVDKDKIALKHRNEWRALLDLPPV